MFFLSWNIFHHAVAEKLFTLFEGVRLGQYLFWSRSEDDSSLCSSCHFAITCFQWCRNVQQREKRDFDRNENTCTCIILCGFSHIWDGRAASLEEQIFHPITSADEMNFSLCKDLSGKDWIKIISTKEIQKVFQKNEIDEVYRSLWHYHNFFVRWFYMNQNMIR